MLPRIIFGKTLACLSNISRLGYVNNYSDSSVKNDDDVQSNAGKTAEESSPLDFERLRANKTLQELLEESASYSDDKNQDWATSPYPQGISQPREEETSEEETNYRERSVFLFPGQGTIQVGAVKKYLHFPNVKDLFSMASEKLGYDLCQLCLHGPPEKLNQTIYNQPATVITCLAALERIREERPKCFENLITAAGYSIGELTALIFSGAISIEHGIKLVASRARCMQNAADRIPQAMLFAYVKAGKEVTAACQEAVEHATLQGVQNPVCDIAVYLGTKRKILAGNIEAIEYLEKNGAKYRLSKMRRLPVAAAFHTQLMNTDLKPFEKVLWETKFNEPRCRVYSNYTAKPYTRNINRAIIMRQICSPVRWEQIMHRIYEQPASSKTVFPRTFDLGSEGRMKTILGTVNEKACAKCLVI